MQQKEKLSDAEKQWVDGKGNVVDDQQVINKLETASDYERGIGRLNETDKDIVQKLCELAGDISKTVGNKRKCALRPFFLCMGIGNSYDQIFLGTEKTNVLNDNNKSANPAPILLLCRLY